MAIPSRCTKRACRSSAAQLTNYEVAPDGEGAVFTWTVALEPRSALSLPFKVFSPLLTPMTANATSPSTG